MTKLQKFISFPIAGVLMLGGGAIAGYASLAGAQTTTPASQAARPMRPAVMGEITAISGSTITVKSMERGSSTAATYTVNASGAAVVKDGTASSLAALVVGDHIGVQGTVSGSSVTATQIMSGRGPGGPGAFGHGKGKSVMGTVSSVSGNTITVTGKDGSTYTINASGAKVNKVVELSVSDIKVGDTIGVEGTVSGSSVTATHIMDGVPPAPQQ